MSEMSDEKKGRSAGRPRTWTPAIGSKLIGLCIDEGRTLGAAAQALGVGRRTVYDWLAASAREGAPPLLASWGRMFRSYRAMYREDERRYHAWLAMKRSKASWQRFRRQRAAYWRETLGPVEFWRRRYLWHLDRGHEVAAARALANLASAEASAAGGFPHTVTP